MDTIVERTSDDSVLVVNGALFLRNDLPQNALDALGDYHGVHSLPMSESPAFNYSVYREAGYEMVVFETEDGRGQYKATTAVGLKKVLKELMPHRSAQRTRPRLSQACSVTGDKKMNTIPANRAVRRAQAATGQSVSPAGKTKKPEPIRWVKVNSNTEAASFGPWVVTVTELPSLSAVDQPNYSVKIEPIDEKAPGIHDWMSAKIFAVRLLALAMKKGLESLVEHGVIGVKDGSMQPGPGEPRK